MKIILISILIRSFGIHEPVHISAPHIDGPQDSRTDERSTVFAQGAVLGLARGAATAPSGCDEVKRERVRQSKTAAAALPGYREYLARIEGGSPVFPASAEDLMQADPFAGAAAFRAQAANELKNVLAVGKKEQATPLAAISSASRPVVNWPEAERNQR